MANIDQHALLLKDVSFHYDTNEQTVPILKGVNVHVADGEFVSIIGASGSGKSTIFRLIVGLEQPTSGSIYINGEKLSNRLGHIGYMPQKDLLMPWRTIEQNASLALEVRNKRNDELVNTLLEEFGLTKFKNNFPHELSGGMRQRLSFLRATLSGSNVLLLDEPFSALDAMTKLFMQEWLLQQWEKRKATILFITHDISEALFLSDRILVVTETPITTLKEFTVPLKRPRKREDLDKEDVLSLKNHLIDQFRMRT